MLLSKDGYQALINRLSKEEDYRRLPYVDTRGIETIGYGRNLEDVGISEEEAAYLMQNDIIRAISELQKNAKIFNTLSEPRQIVLIDMCYNLGIGRLMMFNKMWGAIAQSNYREAAKQMLDSKWAKQVGDRAKKLAYLMETGML